MSLGGGFEVSEAQGPFLRPADEVRALSASPAPRAPRPAVLPAMMIMDQASDL